MVAKQEEFRAFTERVTYNNPQTLNEFIRNLLDAYGDDSALYLDSLMILRTRPANHIWRAER